LAAPVAQTCPQTTHRAQETHLTGPYTPQGPERVPSARPCRSRRLGAPSRPLGAPGGIKTSRSAHGAPPPAPAPLAAPPAATRARIETVLGPLPPPPPPSRPLLTQKARTVGVRHCMGKKNKKNKKNARRPPFGTCSSGAPRTPRRTARHARRCLGVTCWSGLLRSQMVHAATADADAEQPQLGRPSPVAVQPAGALPPCAQRGGAEFFCSRRLIPPRGSNRGRWSRAGCCSTRRGPSFC